MCCRQFPDSPRTSSSSYSSVLLVTHAAHGFSKRFGVVRYRKHGTKHAAPARSEGTIRMGERLPCGESRDVELGGGSGGGGGTTGYIPGLLRRLFLNRTVHRPRSGCTPSLKFRDISNTCDYAKDAVFILLVVARDREQSK